MGKEDFLRAPNFGYCASQSTYYYGYKLHALCGLNGVIHSYDLTKASVHDINYLHDIKELYHDCSIFDDRGYISKEIQLDLFESANIKLKSRNYILSALRSVYADSQLCQRDKRIVCQNYWQD